MDLKALKYVSEAVRYGSITKAASHLRVAQPALSRQIRLLEEELGVPLLVRHRRGIKPTQEGVSLVHAADGLLRMAQQIRDDMASRAAEPVGKIRLGYLPALGDLLIGKLLAEFVHQYPKVTFLLREALTLQLSEALHADRLDLAIMLYEAKHQDLHCKPLFAEDVWLAGAPSIWPFGKRPIHPKQLAGLPLVHADVLGTTLEKMATRHKFAYRSVIEGDTRSAMRVSVRAGAGFIIMPATWVAEEMAQGKLIGAPIKGMELQRWLYWRTDRPLSRASVEFIAALDIAVAKLKATRRSLVRPITTAG